MQHLELNNLQICLLTLVIFFCSFVIEDSFAETESFTVADNNYERKYISLGQGDEIEYSIRVSGGSNDDIEFTIYYPNGSNDGGGFVYESFSDGFVAQSSGTYIFEFDNTFSLLSNKSVQFSYEITKNTYLVYVEDIPNYSKDYASSAVYEATEYWNKIFPKKNFYVADSKSEADIIIQWVKDFTGMNHVGFQYIRLVEIGLGDSNCLGQWNPYSAKHITEITTHEIGHAIGLEHSEDPNSIMYPTVSKTGYGIISQQFNMGENEGMFIPICMSQEPSAIQYSVKTKDPKYGFDAYVIPSKKDFDNLLQGESFTHYSNDECNGEGFLEFSGKCDGIAVGSGLAIIHDSQLSYSTSSITVDYLETEYTGKVSPVETKVYSQTHDTATIDVSIFGDQYDFSSSIYQKKDDSIRFEDGNGRVIHKYNEFAKLGQLFDSFGMSLTKDCLVFSDGRSFCDNNDYSLQFFVNGQEYSSLSQYVFKDGDRIKISYDSIPKPTSSKITTQIEPSKSSTKTIDESSCGEGTVLKDDKCVLDPNLISKEVDDKSLGGGCLIATATFGSELAPQVQQLRELRDNTILSTASGTAFMTGFNQFYYSFSPTVADLEREHPVLKEIIKIALTPMLSSLSLLNYADIDSEQEMLGYGISLILLNITGYLLLPVFLTFRIRDIFSRKISG